MYGLHEIINLIKCHLVMFSLGYAMPSSSFYKDNDAAVRYLQFCSYVYSYGKKGNEHDKEYSLLKGNRFCLLFICLCFSLKPNSVLQSILLIVLSH